jgi:hypothetical protein
MPISENDLQGKIHDLSAAGKSQRAIAAKYGKPVTYGDIGRVLKGEFPKGRRKRVALDLSPSATIILIGDGEIPDGAQAIRALQCKCGQWFISNHPLRTHCFVCRPAKIKHSDRARAGDVI